MKSSAERGAFERKKFRKPDDGHLHNIEIRGGGRSWAGGAVGCHSLSFHLEFMLVCMHLVLAKYFRSTVWWANEGCVFNVHELHSAAVYIRNSFASFAVAHTHSSLVSYGRRPDSADGTERSSLGLPVALRAGEVSQRHRQAAAALVVVNLMGGRTYEPLIQIFLQ